LRNTLTKLDSAVNEAASWLDASQEASIEEYNDKQMELESIANTIIQKLYTQAGAGAARG
jgi:L1 cell adhesion molecule like protein